MRNRSFWARYGAAIVLGATLALFVGVMVYGTMTEEVQQGDRWTW